MSNWNTADHLGSPLSVHDSPAASPGIGAPPHRPPNSRLSSRPMHRRRISHSLTAEPSFKDKAFQTLLELQEKALETWANATTKQQMLFVVGWVVLMVIGISFLVFSPRIFDALAPLAEGWRELPGGWLILFAMVTLTAFPPVIGYSTCLTIAGFVFGMKGWFIAAAANVFGSWLSFMASRTVLSSYVHRLVGEDKRFTAFALTLKHDGIKVLVMIRLCPLPYSLSNAALSTFPTVNTLNFVLATAAATPKLLIHVFVGTRLAAIAESGEKMDLGTKLINWASIIAFGILGAVLSYVIYQKTVARARQLAEEEEAALVEEGEGGYFEEREGYDGEADSGADGWGEDDVSLWDNEPDAREGYMTEGYRDTWSDEGIDGKKGGPDPTILDQDVGGSVGGSRANGSGR